jgi:outer membrane protein OmpA-like peptidoglycan-associated protein
LSSSRNKLGLFYAVFYGKDWIKIREMRFNTEWYNITMPSLSPDGKRLYFACDKPDGYGALDIYYSQMKNGYWDDPVNLGPQVNTSGNESYPFINEAGDLFFSSDGHPGLGGKDIFVTRPSNGNTWYSPVRLEAPVNSEFDDFGIVTDALMHEGYFSSNRGKTIDIYHFRSGLRQIWFSKPQKENQYCFTISDTGSVKIDTTKLKYVWDFGDNSKTVGISVRHCFPGPGKYSINLDINDQRTGNLFFRKLTYDIEIVDIEQPFISSVDYSLTEENVAFNGQSSYCPGYDITGYFWDFGDGIQAQGERTNHVFSTKGEFNVRLGLVLKSVVSGDVIMRAVTKKVIVFQNAQERDAYIVAKPEVKKNLTDIRQFENVIVKGHYSAENDFMKEAVFQVEILSSSERIPLNNSIFRNVPSKYDVKEIYDPARKTYSYIIDEQISLMETHPAYTDIIESGYSKARVRIFVLTDPAEKELLILKKNYGVLTDTYFDVNNKLVTNAYLMLDQVVTLMNRYPGIKLEVGVHTDNQGSINVLKSLSQTRAQVLVNYLINRGISGDRLIARGHGGVRPVASNAGWLERRLNRRVDFKII